MKVRSKNFTLKIGIMGFVALAIVACGSIALKRNTTEAAQKPKVTAPASVPSEFSFTGATGWWQGATNKTSMAVFSNSHSCFTSVEHKSGTLDISVELQKIQAGLTKGGYTSTPGAVQALTLQTAAVGSQLYQLRQYSVTGAGSAGTVEGGQEYGYLQVSNGYLFIQGNCDNASELATTIPALQAIKFDESK